MDGSNIVRNVSTAKDQTFALSGEIMGGEKERVKGLLELNIRER